MSRYIPYIFLLTLFLCGCTTKQESKTDIEKLLIKLPVEDKINFLSLEDGQHFASINGFNIPASPVDYGATGFEGPKNNYTYPSYLALACTWNPQLAYLHGQNIGTEAKAKGKGIVFTTGGNIYRVPQWGRNFENFGEDPYLSGTFLEQTVLGIQSQQIIAAIQYVGCYNQELNHNTNNVIIDPRTLHEVYLYPFRKAVQEAGAGALVMAPNLLNNQYCSENEYLIQDVIRQQWLFDGIVFSDAYASYSPDIVKAGIDVELPTAKYSSYPVVRRLIAHGKVSIENIDKKVKRVVSTHQQLGVYNQLRQNLTTKQSVAQQHQVSRQIAQESIVLLKNQGQTLPLPTKETHSLAIVHAAKEQPGFAGGLEKPTKSGKLSAGKNGFTLPNEMEHWKVKHYYLEHSLDALYKNATFYRPGTNSAGIIKNIYKEANFTEQPVESKILPDIDVRYSNLDTLIGKETYWVEWVADIVPDTSGKYEFALHTNNQCNIYLDNQIFMLGYPQEKPTIQEESKTLVANQRYRLRITQKINADTYIRFGYGKQKNVTTSQLAAIAGKYDYTLILAGFSAITEGAGKDRSYNLPARQDALIHQIAGTNTKSIVYLTSGGGIDMSNWINDIDALLYASYLGDFGEDALANILTGQISPSGRLPFTMAQKWEKHPAFFSYDTAEANKALPLFHLNHIPQPYTNISYAEGLYNGYKFYDVNNIEPLFPFGFGLSYSEFEYQNLQVNEQDNQTVATVTIKNTGKYKAPETVQMYISDTESADERPIKELKAFRKVMLEPGESTRITIPVTEEMLQYFNNENNLWMAEPGEFIILVGPWANNIKLTASFTWSGK